MFRLRIMLCVTLAGAFVSTARSEKLNFNPDWRFIKADPADAQRVGFDDSGWISVSTPHTFNDIDTFDNWSPRGLQGEYKQWSGRTWYRKHFDVPTEWKNKRIYIEFEAARQIAEVYLNGVPLGKSENGFIPFGFDLTPHLKFGQENVLAVMCDNRFVSDADGKGNKWHVYEGGSKFSWNNPHWHPAHGGLYRNVFLHVKDPVHITLPLFNNLKSVGTYIYTPEVSFEKAQVGFEAQVENSGKRDVSVSLRVDILDMDNRVVASMRTTRDLAADKRAVLALKGSVAKPHLWEPAYPYLYTARATLRSGGRVCDTVDTPLGIRSWKFTSDKGFFINGHRVKLHGWGQKPTSEWAGLGSAYPDWMHWFTLNMMAEAGGNIVRWGHCAGGPVQVRVSDQLGLITIQPGVDGEGDIQGHGWDVRATAFRDMIIYYRNNPSILIWEGGNQAVRQSHLEQLVGYVKKYDPFGKRAYAHRRPSGTTIKMSDIEIGTQGSRKFGYMPVVEGEYDREESPRRVWDRFSPPDYGYKVKGKQAYVLTSEEYAVNQVKEYVNRIGKIWHCGGANWIFSDSTSGGRNSSEVTRASGEVDAVRLPKEAYFACKAMFHSKPQLHIIGHWTYPADRKTTKNIYVVSNCQSVELLVNGKSAGRGAKSFHYLFTFDNISYKPGKIEARGFDADGNLLTKQTKETVGKAVALKLTPISGPHGFMATGSDVLLVDVEAVDAQGRRCPTIQQRVDFEMSGPAVWRGGYNSGKINSINNKYLYIECGINRIAVRSTRTAGAVTVIAKSAGLKPAILTVRSNPVTVKHGVMNGLPPIPEQVRPDPANIPQRNELELGMSDVNAVVEGRFIKGFSYSGHSMSVKIKKAENGAKIYLDRDYRFSDLPQFLAGADYVQLPNNEKLYKAVDLMDFRVSADGILYIAHDDRIPRPQWLTDDFKKTGYAIRVNNAHLTLFMRRMKAGSSVTIGSNRKSGSTAITMYVPFFSVKRISK